MAFYVVHCLHPMRRCFSGALQQWFQLCRGVCSFLTDKDLQRLYNFFWFIECFEDCCAEMHAWETLDHTNTRIVFFLIKLNVSDAKCMISFDPPHTACICPDESSALGIDHSLVAGSSVSDIRTGMNDVVLLVKEEWQNQHTGYQQFHCKHLTLKCAF